MSVYVQRLRQRLQDGTTVFDTAGYVLSILYALVIIIPLYYILVSAFKDNMQIFGAPLALPARLGLENFVKAEAAGNLGRAIVISLGVMVSAEVLTVLVAFPAAYAIARIRTPLAGPVEGFFSLGFLIPAFAMLVPVLLLMAKLGVLYSPMSLVLFYPAWRLPLAIVVLASYLRTVPRELEESAEIDGASRLQIVRHVLFPLARPGVITVVIINAITFWNEYLFALILLNQKNRTMQVALAVLEGEHLVHYGVLAAGIIISILPVFFVFILFQEQVVEGLYAGAVKG
jgi:multiple sugar transport system permease protein